MMGFYLGLLIACLLVSALFCMMEASYISVQRSRLRYLVEQGSDRGAQVEKLIQHPARLLAAVLLSNNLVQTAAAALGTVVAVMLWGEGWGLLAATVVVGMVTFLFAETIPKSFAVRHAEGTAMFLALPLRWLLTALSPLVGGIAWIASRLGGGPVVYTLSQEEISSVISLGQESGAVEEKAAEMMHQALSFRERRVKEVMTPRPDIVAVEQGISLREFLSLYAQHPYSRFPIYRHSLDQVVGLLAVKEVLLAQAQGTLGPHSPIDPLIRPVEFVPESKPLGQLLTAMQASGTRLVLTVDEYGVVSGLVTSSQLVELIVGEIRDELGREEEWEAINEYTFEVDGTLRVEEANEKLGLGIPEGDYQTVAGFLLYHLGHIPRVGEHFHFQGWKMEVTHLEGRKVERLLVTRMEKE